MCTEEEMGGGGGYEIKTLKWCIVILPTEGQICNETASLPQFFPF